MDLPIFGGLTFTRSARPLVSPINQFVGLQYGMRSAVVIHTNDLSVLPVCKHCDKWRTLDSRTIRIT